MPTSKSELRIDSPVERDGMLHVGAPNVGDRAYFDRLVREIFDRRWFTNDGCVVRELERRIKQFLGVKHCFVVCNATVGLQLAFHALELTGEVIVPAFTFVATPHAALWEGLTPVFADVDPQTHTICPESVRSLLTNKTSAIIGVHLWGNPCDDESIQQIARERGLAVVYDSAHAFGCRGPDGMVGNFGNCEVFSFHATKFFNTFEGGAITTNDDQLAERISLMRNFGFAGMDEVVHLGTNAKLPEICAAMGLSVFACLDQLIEHNRYNHGLYRAHLGEINGLRLLDFEHLPQCNWQYVVLEIDEDRFGVSRDSLMQRLHGEGVRARRYFYPGCHRMEPYRSMTRNQSLMLPNTDRLCRRVLCLPTGSAIEDADVERVCTLIRGYYRAKAPNASSGPRVRCCCGCSRRTTKKSMIRNGKERSRWRRANRKGNCPSGVESPMPRDVRIHTRRS